MEPEPRTRTRNPERGTQNYRFHAIVDVEASEKAGWTVVDLAHAFLDGGARLIQLRAKRVPSGQFLRLAEVLVRDAATYGGTIVVNDRADIAALAHAGGVHVGQDDLSPSGARRVVGNDAIVGYSTHTIEQVQTAVREPVSYIAVGPVFQTGTKATGYQPVGLDLVSRAAAISRGLPVIAIGGITLATVPEVLAAGATGVAVISDLLTGGTTAARIAAYCRLLAL